MTVAKLMKQKSHDVITGTAEMTVLDATRMLERHRIGAVVIVNASGGVAGILSERDIVQAIARNGAGVLDRRVSAFMTSDVVTCETHSTVADVMATMTRGKFRHMPIVNNGLLDGIVSIGDVVKYRIEEAEAEAQAMREYITTG